MKKIIWALILGAICCVPAGAQEDIKLKAYGWVNDFAGVLPLEDRNSISAIAAELERTTSAEIAVVTVDTLGDQSMEEYAVNLFQKWGIGKKGKDNGILIIAALKERQVRIEVGYGLEGVITDGISGRIIREKITPDFKQGNYGAGLFKATAAIAYLIARDAGVELSEIKALPGDDYQISARTAMQDLIGKLIYLVILFLVFGGRMFIFPLLFPFFGGGRYWSGGGGGFGGGGFGGFGGGMSGGGGATGRW